LVPRRDADHGGSAAPTALGGSLLELPDLSWEDVVSVASMIDLWYVSRSTGRVSTADLGEVRRRLSASHAVRLEPVSLAVADPR
jgi:hypothetical protein